jgi:hypothetical protein
MRRYEPTDEQRRTVRTMAGFGVPHEDIATFLGIDAKTLRKHFRAELDRGTVEANAKVAQSLFQMATQGKNVAAAIFWMKARAGWREKVEIKPVLDDPEQLTDAQLEAIVRSGRVPRPQLEVRLVDETTGAKEEER